MALDAQVQTPNKIRQDPRIPFRMKIFPKFVQVAWATTPKKIVGN